MKELNDTNGASLLTHSYAKRCLTEFEGPLFGVEMGIAYGGGVQQIGTLWNTRGTVWGFDTFEGHPKELAEKCDYTKEAGGKYSHAALCMDYWYNDQINYGTERFKYEYMRAELDKLGLTNVRLVKGVVSDTTDVSFIPKLHYVLLDMDFPLAQWDGYNLVKHKIVKGGYLCMHDMIPPGHIHGCYERYMQILAEDLFDIVREDYTSLLVVLKKK